MKKISILSLIAASGLAIASCGGQKEEKKDPHAGHDHSKHNVAPTDVNAPKADLAVFKEEAYTKVYHKYLILKDALVMSDAVAAKNAAIALKAEISGVTGLEQAAIANDVIANSNNLEEQRKLFTDLSNMLITFLSNKPFVSGVIYVQFCPMANQDKGGYWLSNEKQVMNPYFGDQMLHCGSVEEELN